MTELRLHKKLDTPLDLAKSLPREYHKAPKTAIVAAQSVNGDPSFQLLAERSLNPVLLFLGGTLTAALFWACVTAVAHLQKFPTLFLDSASLQALVQSDLALAQSPSEEDYSVCMTAQHDIPHYSAQPLFTFDFAPPGASGVALIDGKIVKIFRNEQRLSIRADVFAGDHRFVLHLDKPAETTSMSSNADFKYCPPE